MRLSEKRLSEKAMIRSLLFAAPMILSSTIAISPSRAASFASSAATLTLENFTQEGNSPLSGTATDTLAIETDGTVTTAANATAEAALTHVTQSTLATVQGVGRNYSGSAVGASATALNFDTGCGCFRFDFQATLASIAQLTNPVPGESATATSSVAFAVFDLRDLDNPIDVFAASLTAGNPFNLVSTPNIYFTSIPDLNQAPESVFVNGYYARHFEEGTQLQVQALTSSTAIATVPEPPMFAALVILPGLMWLKRRKAKVVAQPVTIDRRSE